MGSQSDWETMRQAADVLKQFGERPIKDARVTLVGRDIETPYSGMIPGFVAGRYDTGFIERNKESLLGYPLVPEADTDAEADTDTDTEADAEAEADTEPCSQRAAFETAAITSASETPSASAR